MTPQQMIGVGVRLFSLWLAFEGLHYVAAMPSALENNMLSFGVPFAYLIGVAYFVVAALLWLFPMVIAHWLIPRTRFADAINLSALEASRVGAALLGLWVLVQAGPDLASYLFRLFLVNSQGSLSQSMGWDQKQYLLFLILQVAFSLLLIFKSAAIAAYLMRTSTPKSVDEDAL